MPPISHTRVHHHGFTLVELAVVLTVLGLLIGGVLGGKALIRNAQVNSVATEMQKIMAATEAFKLEYNALPGDMANATAYWGAADGGDGTGSDCYLVDSTDSQATCNGNGNLEIMNVSTVRERQRFWQHLTNAGLIEGNYGATHGPAGEGDHVAGFNAMATKITPDAAWTVITDDASYGDSWPGEYGHTLNMVDGTRNTTGIYDVVIPAEMFKLDRKYDDGSPAKGLIRSYAGNTVNVNCTTDRDQEDARYNLDFDQPACAFRRLQAF